jgi:hypothetical protein
MAMDHSKRASLAAIAFKEHPDSNRQDSHAHEHEHVSGPGNAFNKLGNHLSCKYVDRDGIGSRTLETGTIKRPLIT